MANVATGNRVRALFQSERQREIVARTLQADLARDFEVTAETIRGDLSELQERQLVRRVHGGAAPWQTQGFEPLLAVRNDLQVSEKRRIAQAMIRSAQRVVALVDFSKYGNDHLIRFADWSEVDVLVTDERADEATVARIEAYGPTVLRA